MHRRSMLTILALGLALLPAGAGAQIFQPFDWLLHRGTPERFGHNGGDNIAVPTLKSQLWVYPPTSLMPAEMVVNNGNISTPVNATGQSATGVDTPGNPWIYSPTASADRGPGAWPPSDVNPNVVGDYVFANAEFDKVLSDLANADLDPTQPGPEGISELLNLPNVSSYLESRRIAGKNFYKIVDDELQANTTYYRWSFGGAYPQGTFQGKKDVSNVKLTPFQRYMVFIRFPSSSTTVGGVVRPNTKYVFVRVSWGANVNDPVTSRIFMLNFDQQGGFWLRVRNATDDDRFFPYDGVNPIQVTLYTRTFTEPNDIGVSTIVPADAVRLVPEALRGDIHAPPSSAAFPPGSDPLNTPGSVELTYFGRDETTGPKPIYTGTAIGAAPPPGQFTSIPFDPTKPPDQFNPHVADSTSSVRSAVFYCLEDDYINKSFSKLRWRYVAATAQTPPAIVDDTIPPQFTSVGFNPVVDPGTETAYGAGWHEAPTQPGPAPVATATWTTSLAQDTSYTVYVWIPGNQAVPGAHFATNAHYVIQTESGPVDYFLNQEDARNMHGIPQVGGWIPLASGIRFPVAGPGTSAVVTLDDVSALPADVGRVVVADAIQYIPESRTRNSVRAAPLIASVVWPSGVIRQVVYFATYESSQLWALDCAGAGGQSTNTTVYWSYPSVTNPDPAQVPPAGFSGVYDPNYLPDPQNNQTNQGIDGDYVKATVSGKTVYIIDQQTKVPDLGRFASSPAYVEVPQGAGRRPYIVIGNTNGKLYAFDPAGRVNNNAMIGTVGDPFPSTFATPLAPGVPGTTRREMTWPSTKRDKWLDKGAPGFPNNPDQGIKQFSEDIIDGAFTASPTIPIDRNVAQNPNTGAFPADRVVIGATDGHIYCVNLATNALDPTIRISNKNANPAGSPRWRYPAANKKIDPINQVGTVTPNGQFIFTSFGLFGARVYAVQDPGTTANGVASLTWIYPFTATPPGNPNNALDHPGLDTPFTAPVWLPKNTIPGFNNNNEVCFIANTSGQVYALDASQNGGQEPKLLWTDTDPISGLNVPSPSRTFGTTRASTVFLNRLQRTARTFGPIQAPPALLQPLDTGEWMALDATTGRQIYDIFDGTVGQVPVSVATPGGNIITPTFTSTVWRGADATTANNVIYVGDEGNQDTGEMNGQMRTYTDTGLGFGFVTPDELVVNPNDFTSLDLRLVDLWPDPIWDKFGDTPANGGLSPFNERANAKSNTQNKVLIFELGDRMYTAAWGAFYYDPADPSGNYVNFPRVTFTRYSGSAQDTLQATGVIDQNYAGPALVLDPVNGDTHPVLPWVAKVIFPFDKGNETQPNVPGRRYTVFAQAQVQRGGAVVQSNRLSAGQFDPQPYDGAHDVNDLPPGRVIALAHPLTITTRGGFNAVAEGAGFFNIVGWTNNYQADLSNVDISEILANGNRVIDPASLNVVNNKGVVAPLGLINHGTSNIYMGVDNAGKRVQSLYLADRSNMYKLGKPLDTVRVERRDLAWGLPDPANVEKNVFPKDNNRVNIRIATGNVMNPLPWEIFPSMVPNVSPDYPDLDRRHAQMRGNGFDMVDRGISLPPAQVNGGQKILSPLALELQIDVPRFQPANVNRDYYDMNGALNPGLNNGLMAPMVNSTGLPPDVTNGADPLRGLSAPSAGYTSPFVIYIASNPRETRFVSAAATANTTQTPISTREDTYRQMAAGVAVPPDVALRTEEETLDIGKTAHSMGYTPYQAGKPFAPSGVGPYGLGPAPNFESPFDPYDVGQARFFLPFTVRNTGNVNLVDIRLAKILGDYNSDPADPSFWTHMRSDQVESIPAVYDPADTRNLLVGPPNNLLLPWILNSPIAGVPYLYGNNYLSTTGAAAQIGVVSSTDHMRDVSNQPNKTQFEIDYPSIFGINKPNFWPMANPYVDPSNVFIQQGATGDGRYAWAAGSQPVPTIHKAYVGDASPTTMSIPDTAHGDPAGYLSALATDPVNPRPDTRPKVGVAIPMGTPAGTYSVPLYVFEDNVPEQWREWMYLYNTAGATNLRSGEQFGDRDGLLTIPLGPNDTGVIRESIANPNFVLKATVTETRITDEVHPPLWPVSNGVTPGTFIQLDDRPAGQNAFGSNILPAVQRDRGTGNIFMYFASNRLNGNVPLANVSSNDIPWYLFFTQLKASVNGSGATTFFDWLFDSSHNSWWNPLPNPAQFPTSFVLNPKNLFPSETADVPAGTTLPTVPGVMNPQSERHASPAIAQDDDLSKPTPATWLFWQGSVYKTTAGAQNFQLDTRTFYTPLQNGVPNPPGGMPFSFLNDPNLPKFSPKPMVITTVNSQTYYYLFWHGGAQGRTRLYYNVNAVDVTDTKQWSRDESLATPGALQWQAQPSPVHRQLIQPDGTIVDAIDVYYAGQLINHKQSETLMTRYKVLANGRLDVMPQTTIDFRPQPGGPNIQRTGNELMVREGASQTWQSRDIGWMYRDPVTRNFTDANGFAPYTISIIRSDGTLISPVNTGQPTFDNANGRLYWNSALGGQMIVDPHAGTVTFTSVAPRSSDRVQITYTPLTLRINTSRNDSQVIDPPAGWQSDAGFTPRSHVSAPGNNSSPVAFLDRSPNPRLAYSEPVGLIMPGTMNVPATIDRQWVLFRKSNSNVTAPEAIYYKTMRLMVRLPRGVLLDIDQSNKRNLTKHLTITGNRGPVEVDWIRGRLYFTQADEGNVISVTKHDYARDAQGNVLSVPSATPNGTFYRVAWGDEISVAVAPGDQTTGEAILPTDAAVNEGQISAFKDPFQDRVWVFWSSTRAGTTDIYYMPIAPRFYPIPSQ